MTPAFSNLEQLITKHPELSFRQVDVFCEGPQSGNPAMVVFGGENLSAASMQEIATAAKLSETVFILPASGKADFRTRIFTIRREIPFAGHPALAAAHGVSEELGCDSLILIQQDGLGLTHIFRAARGAPWQVKLPAPIHDTPAERCTDEIAAMLGISTDALSQRSAVIMATGVRWIFVELKQAATLETLRPKLDVIADWSRDSKVVGLVPFALSDRPGVDVELRSFAPAEGINEDPVCGSCAGALAALMAGGTTYNLTFRQMGSAKRLGCMSVRFSSAGAPILSGKTETAQYVAPSSR